MRLHDCPSVCATQHTTTVEDVMFCFEKMASALKDRFKALYTCKRNNRTIEGCEHEFIYIFERPPAGDKVLLLKFNMTMFLDPSVMIAHALAFINDVVAERERELVCDVIKRHITDVIGPKSLSGFRLDTMNVSEENATQH